MFSGGGEPFGFTAVDVIAPLAFVAFVPFSA
jgi:hypothetical protein